MSVAVGEQVKDDAELVGTDDGDDLTHYVCDVCYPDGSPKYVSYCGMEQRPEDRLADEYMAMNEDVCVVCKDLDKTHLNMHV